MEGKIIFEKDSAAIKNPKHLQRSFYFIHCQKLKLNLQVS